MPQKKPASLLDLLPGPRGETPAETVQRRFPAEWDVNPYVRSINGPQGYPDFRGMINPAGWDAFLAQAPMSTNIEDRRGDEEAFRRAALMRSRYATGQ